jgi:hypothetical protein
MKKFICTAMLLALLSFSVFADGEMGASKSCTPGQNCLIQTGETTVPPEKPWYVIIIEKWDGLFG